MVCNKHTEKPNSLWYVGVILSIVGSICTNMGVNLQKFSFMREAKGRSVVDKRGYFRQPLWVIGLLLVVGGSILDFVALGFLPQSLATPVGGSTMVANVVFASLFLKEKFTRSDAIGTALVLLGIIVVATFAEKESKCYTVHELVALYREPLFAVYATLMCVSCVILFFLMRKMERTLKHKGRTSLEYKRFRKLHPVSYPALSGIFGAQSVLFAKSMAELMKTTIEGDNQFVTVGAYAITLSMFTCVFMQIHWLAHGLQKFDAVFVVPVFQCFFISVSIFGGGVYFKEFAQMKPLALAMFTVGAIITISGVVKLAHRDMHKLSPLRRMRATASMLLFIYRCQKARNIKANWGASPSQSETARFSHEHHVPLICTKKLAAQPESSVSPPSSKLLGQRSKASVLPVGPEVTAEPSAPVSVGSVSASASITPEPVVIPAPSLFSREVTGASTPSPVDRREARGPPPLLPTKN
ncbi:Magnesium transporter NIPA2 [Phytophthora cinnamomi]|uniref:Magnesium transporter NIPA2 n=1 Tax=Phytophthora cinnamomi TaxID=4785 RepID=UPI0035595C90|nr:Magnesium transporter NIPA2 [Phytophthora cinnamomi]